MQECFPGLAIIPHSKVDLGHITILVYLKTSLTYLDFKLFDDVDHFHVAAIMASVKKPTLFTS